MKRVYFACSIRGGRDDQAIYQEIVDIIKTNAVLLSELFADKSLSAQGHTNLTDQEIYNRDIDWIKEADYVIAEVTNPSLGVGYEISTAEAMNKPVLALFRSQTDRRLSAMIAGSPKTRVIEYTNPSELKGKIKDFLN